MTVPHQRRARTIPLDKMIHAYANYPLGVVLQPGEPGANIYGRFGGEVVKMDGSRLRLLVAPHRQVECDTCGRVFVGPDADAGLVAHCGLRFHVPVALPAHTVLQFQLSEPTMQGAL